MAAQRTGVPGTSARAEYERRRARRMARERAAGREPTAQSPAHERAWLQGAEGEERFGHGLNGAARLHGEAATLHDLAAPGQRANIDHIVVGPAGVTVIDAKTLNGRVWVGHSAIGQGARASRKPIVGVQRQVAAVRAVLDAAGYPSLGLVGLVCLVNSDGATDVEVNWIDGVGVAGPTVVTRYALRPGPVDGDVVLAVEQALGAAFDVRGGGWNTLTGGSTPAPAIVPAPSVPSAEGRVNAHPTRRARKAPARSRRRRLRRPRLRVLALVGLLLIVRPWDVSLPSLAPPAPAGPLTRATVDMRVPELRAMAVDLAGGEVRGPRITTSTEGFVLRFRRGKRCRVRLGLVRAEGGAAFESVRYRVTRCG